MYIWAHLNGTLPMFSFEWHLTNDDFPKSEKSPSSSVPCEPVNHVDETVGGFLSGKIWMFTTYFKPTCMSLK